MATKRIKKKKAKKATDIKVEFIPNPQDELDKIKITVTANVVGRLKKAIVDSERMTNDTVFDQSFTRHAIKNNIMTDLWFYKFLWANTIFTRGTFTFSGNYRQYAEISRRLNDSRFGRLIKRIEDSA